MELRTFKIEQLEEVKKLYFCHRDAKIVAKYYKCSPGAVLRFLKYNNVEINMSLSKKIYSCNENVFDEINENSAYWLGFLFADGYHHVKSNTFYLTQRSNESDNLVKLKEFLNHTGEIKNYLNKNNGHRYSRLGITNIKLSKRLLELGIMQNKTHILNYPLYINNEILFKNFLRGYFDGDGSISKGYFSIVGNKTFINILQENIIKYLRFNKTVFQKRHKERNNEIVSLMYSGKRQILILFKFLYEEANYYSRYKYEKFINDINNSFDLSNSQHTNYYLIEYFYKKSGLSSDKIINYKKPIFSYTHNGDFYKKYDSLKDAISSINIKCHSNITSSIKNNGTAGGLIWRYEYFEKIQIINKENSKHYKYFIYKNDYLIKSFENKKEIDNYFNKKTTWSCISTACKNNLKTYLGYNWERKL